MGIKFDNGYMPRQHPSNASSVCKGQALLEEKAYCKRTPCSKPDRDVSLLLPVPRQIGREGGESHPTLGGLQPAV